RPRLKPPPRKPRPPKRRPLRPLPPPTRRLRRRPKADILLPTGEGGTRAPDRVSDPVLAWGMRVRWFGRTHPTLTLRAKEQFAFAPRCAQPSPTGRGTRAGGVTVAESGPKLILV